ncbi:hypothetical protein BDV96DRAFT_614876 [Lophiotrema nucula]|uniref:LCCL domain-containing protein n=1 Tax=Lophiotrema nucula TaxID=690887 RepID=A0A6A5YY90_9PLEO|nr:hypothetical protein BDV96DRAFT_614876 [Lophiotrema nucula]
MPASDNRTDRHDDNDHTIAGAEADEEAQLLYTEDFEFEDNVPPPARRSLKRGWFDRPRPVVPNQIKPLYPSLQEAPLLLLNRVLPRRNHKVGLLAGLLTVWVVIFVSLLTAQLPVKDAEGQDVVNLDCVDSLWRRKNECGLNGIDCRPFSNKTFAFRCPAKCLGVQLLNPRAVGPWEVNYQPLVVGSNPYRSDSFICGSAIHSGIISDGSGGCGRLSLTGREDSFSSTRHPIHGIESVPVDSYFPSSFTLAKDSAFKCPTDPRNKILFVSLVFTAALSIFLVSPWQFFILFIMIFAHVSFASDPPSASYRNITVLPDHISMFAKRLLPALFCAVVLYWTTVRRTIDGLRAQYEKTLLWLGGFWFGALSNYTFEWIPISRLNAHDIEQQPGAKLALAIILIVLIIIVFQQIYYFWKEGRLIRYLGIYGLFLLGIFVFLAIPGVSLRLHHYIIALLLLPGTSMQTRPSLLYQGILLGLFVNGVARWDFDSILQTADALRSDAKFDSLVPAILSSDVVFGASTTFSFEWKTPPVEMDGISATINDVERFRTFFGVNDENLPNFFEWHRSPELESPEYVRFAYIRGGRTLDYTKAGTLYQNGTFEMVSNPSEPEK